MKRRILFVVTYFDCGGTNRALQNMLNRIDAERYDIDVFGMVPDGMFSNLYKNCRVLPRHLLLSSLMARYSQQKGSLRFLSALIKVLNRASKGLVGERIKKKSAKRLKKIGYDTVVAFSEGAPTAFVRLMNHPNSVAWIHCDYASYKQLNGNVDEHRVYSHYKRIVCVAGYPLQSFVSCFPDMETRTTFIYNIQDDDMMKAMAKEEINGFISEKQFNIVSVGRLDPVKRLSVVPILAKQLIDAGCAFKWYVIGPKGGTLDEYHNLMKNIAENRVDKMVVYLGEQKNPYAYISRAELLVNTSISEACPYVVNEAKILHTPVVCTNFGSASEFISDGFDGFICPIEDMANTIIRYIKDEELQGKVNKNISAYKYNNAALLQQIYKVLE